jgi:hypothetical protein
VVSVKKGLARVLLLMGCFTLLALVIPQPSAMAHHRVGHHCKIHPHVHPNEFYKEKAEEQGVSPGKIRQQHKHHKHQCHPYPPGAGKAPTRANPRASGSSATLPVESQSAVTVGVALAIAAGVILALLALRRRWVFSSRR